MNLGHSEICMILYLTRQSGAGHVNRSQEPGYVGLNDAAFFSPLCAHLMDYLLRHVSCTLLRLTISMR